MNVEELEALKERTRNFIENGFYGAGKSRMEDLFSVDLTDVREDGILLKFHVSDWQRTPVGDLQSGMLLSMLDYAVGLTCVPRIGFTKPVNVDVNFLERIGPDCADFDVNVSIEKKGRTIIFVTCRAVRPDGVTAALSVFSIMEHRSQYELTHKSRYELEHENQEQLEHEKQLELEHKKTYQLPYSEE